MKELKIDNQLDSNLRQLKIDDKSTNIELATDKLRINSNTVFDKDVTINGEMNVQGGTGVINMTNGTNITSGQTGGTIIATAQAFAVYGITWAGDEDATDNPAVLAMLPATGQDSKLNFYDGALIKWTVGNDADDSHKLKFDATNTNVGGNTKLTLEADGDLITTGDVSLVAGKGLYLDGAGGHTSLVESADDVVRLIVGGDIIMHITENGDDGNQVNFLTASVGFTQIEPTYDATNTFVDFRKSNKQNLTFVASITNLNLQFPEMSGNFTLLLKQDGTGSRTITNYKVQEFDESAADGEVAVKFAGGCNPTLTTDANHVDILSFYWDADNEICYGVATLDFQF